MKRIVKRSPYLKESELRHMPVVIRVNSFDEKSAKEFARQMELAHNSGQDTVPIIIDSYGGQVYSLMSMIGDIKNSDKPVATIIVGKAMSCGAILSTFGHTGMRYMDPHATVMIHDVSSMKFGKVEEIKSSSRETERLNKSVYKMMAKNCGQRPNYFLDIVHDKGHADWFLNAQACLKHRIVNNLYVPNYEISIDVSYKLT
jgi:ATP-dependent Clp protease, protease subunit